MSRKIKIAFVCPWYSSQFGYIVNNLPRALVKNNVEAHIITSNSQLFSTTPDFETTYKSFIGEKFVQTGVFHEYGVSIHRLPYKMFKTEMHFSGLFKKLREIKPDVVQIYDLNSIITFKLALYKPFLKYKFLNANHILASVFPLAKNWKTLGWFQKLKWNLLHVLPGKYISSQTNLTIYPTIDAKELAISYMGFKDKKNIIKSLSVETDLYKPLDQHEKTLVRQEFNFSETTFICIYTGRFSEEKNPLILAKAIECLRNKGHEISGFFIGEGIQKDMIAQLPHCTIHEFTSQQKLARFYTMADVGVWPREESTSMLDCLSCGTPIIVNNTIKAIERIEGNGLLFEKDNATDLAEKILYLVKNSDQLKIFATQGINKIQNQFSWNKYAKDYLQLIQDLQRETLN